MRSIEPQFLRPSASAAAPWREEPRTAAWSARPLRPRGATTGRPRPADAESRPRPVRAPRRGLQLGRPWPHAPTRAGRSRASACGGWGRRAQAWLPRRNPPRRGGPRGSALSPTRRVPPGYAASVRLPRPASRLAAWRAAAMARVARLAQASPQRRAPDRQAAQLIPPIRLGTPQAVRNLGASLGDVFRERRKPRGTVSIAGLRRMKRRRRSKNRSRMCRSPALSPRRQSMPRWAAASHDVPKEVAHPHKTCRSTNAATARASLDRAVRIAAPARVTERGPLGRSTRLPGP